MRNEEHINFNTHEILTTNFYKVFLNRVNVEAGLYTIWQIVPFLYTIVN